MSKNISKKPDGFEEITNAILSYIEENNNLPWRSKSWRQELNPVNFDGKSYNGGNFWNLSIMSMVNEYPSSRWITWNQAKKIGAKVKNGETKNYQRVLYYKQLKIDAEKSRSGEAITIPMPKWYCVYNVSQIEGLPEEFYNEPVVNDNLTIDTAEELIKRLPGKVIHEDCTPHFHPKTNEIHVPEMCRFESSEHYYSTLSHEYIHWTGKEGRLDRFSDDVSLWTRDEYAAEELVAELGAAYLLPKLGIKPLIDDDHAPYIKTWYERLKNDKKYFFKAASQAQKAVNYLTDLVQNPEATNEADGEVLLKKAS